MNATLPRPAVRPARTSVAVARLVGTAAFLADDFLRRFTRSGERRWVEASSLHAPIAAGLAPASPDAGIAATLVSHADSITRVEPSVRSAGRRRVAECELQEVTLRLAFRAVPWRSRRVPPRFVAELRSRCFLRSLDACAALVASHGVPR